MIGSSFDDWLKREGLTEEVEEALPKRIISYRLSEAMQAQDVSVSELARRMKTSRTQVMRLLNANEPAITLTSLQRAATALGLKLQLDLI